MGEDVNAKDCVRYMKHSDTPLHLAVFSKNIEVIEFLVAHGADQSAKNNVMNS